MRKTSIYRQAYVEVSRVPVHLVALLCTILLSMIYPSNLGSYPIRPSNATVPVAVSLTDKYVRFIPTAIQVAAPLLLRDKIGAVQLLYVAIANTIATQAAKRLLNDCEVMGTKLGKRPNGGPFNMPSGHSSMASCAVFFVIRRYGLWLGLPLAGMLLIILLLTMYARVALNAHTVSAVIAGALIGLISTLLFTSKRTRQAIKSGKIRAPARP